MEAEGILQGKSGILDYCADSALSFDKWVVLINFRDNGVYFHNPIYLHLRYFSYFLDRDTELKFDTDDLFFYSEHRIQRRGGHLFCENFGTQMSLKSRYGIRPFAVKDRDYVFINGDETDFRYANIKIINRYFGVQRISKGYRTYYKSSIHVRGIFKLGVFESEEEAAIAYNKALDFLLRHKKKAGLRSNYIEDLSPAGYADIYSRIELPERFLNAIENL